MFSVPVKDYDYDDVVDSFLVDTNVSFSVYLLSPSHCSVRGSGWLRRLCLVVIKYRDAD